MLAGLAWLLLRPGLGGAFLFDDMANLAALDRVSLINWSQGDLAEFLGTNRSGPTGRPVAMLSFLINEGSWPISARPFLRTNLLLHLLIGVVVLGLVRRLVLLGTAATARRATLFAVVAAGLWLLHPLQASTVFYTVQRMAQLSALFMLASVYVYLLGRGRLVSGRSASGWFCIGLAPLLAAVGAYAKENAVLVPLALLLVEYWFLDTPTHRFRGLRPLRILMLWLPSALIALYLASRVGSAGYLARDFTAVERLMTQARVLIDYLGLVLIPQQTTAGLFHDAYPVSTGLLRPWTTLPAILACITLVTISIAWRRRFPLVTWGVLFFFAMHLAESSTLPLELYFEHRNYLPSLGALVAVTGIGFMLYDYRCYLGVLGLATMLGTVALLGHLRAQNWGHPLRQAEIWVRIAPESPRAWQNLALRNHQYGLPSGTEYALARAQRLRPEHPLPRLSRLVYECPQRPITAERWASLRALASDGACSHGLVVILRDLAGQAVASGELPRAASRPGPRAPAFVAGQTPDVSSRYARQHLWHIDGQLLLVAGFVDDAMAAFQRSHEILVDPGLRATQANHLLKHGYAEQALLVAERAPRNTGAKSLYGPFHVYWIVHDPGRIEALARKIRAQRDAAQETGIDAHTAPAERRPRTTGVDAPSAAAVAG
ncbi:MAG: hypothetical protein U5K43_11275 [Halofilum sp. (in: g-proteobacteria)]|nr:hypothetical protein [Halofilum sp. (in: g-proteobacteria)]